MGSNQKSVNHHVFRCVKIFDFLTERFLITKSRKPEKDER